MKQAPVIQLPPELQSSPARRPLKAIKPEKWGKILNERENIGPYNWTACPCIHYTTARSFPNQSSNDADASSLTHTAFTHGSCNWRFEFPWSLVLPYACRAASVVNVAISSVTRLGYGKKNFQKLRGEQPNTLCALLN